MKKPVTLLLLAAAFTLPAWWLMAQGNQSDTARLEGVLSVPPFDGSKALYDAMDTVGTTVTTVKTEGVDKTLEIAQKAFEEASKGNRHAAKQMSGLTKGADARAWQANQAGTGSTIRKIRFVGDLIEIVDAFSSAGGYLAEGDTTGAAAIFINALGKKGAAGLGAAGGSIVGPAGAVVGAEGGSRAYDKYVADKVNKLADDKRNQDARDANLGFSMTGRYAGQVTWVTTPQYDASAATAGAPPMTFRFQGPMTADLDRAGNLKLHYDLKGAMEGLGVAGATMGIGMTMQMSVNADLAGMAKDGVFQAKGHSSGTSQFNVDYRGHAGAPANQSQTSTGGSPVEASGTFSRETLSGTITSIGVKAKPITFTLTKQRS